MTLSDINRIHNQRTAIPDKVYSARDNSGRIRYWIGCSDKTLKKHTPGISLVIENTEVVTTTTTTSGISSDLLISYIATDNITAFDVVTSNGKKADSSITAYKNKIIGISTTTTNIGFAGTAVGFGEIQNPLWSWTIGDKIFLNGITLSTTDPGTGFIQLIGTAVKADTIDIKISQSILL